LPIEQPTDYRMVVNAKTAKALDYGVPATFLYRATELIE